MKGPANFLKLGFLLARLDSSHLLISSQGHEALVLALSESGRSEHQRGGCLEPSPCGDVAQGSRGGSAAPSAYPDELLRGVL